jgi:two-component system chemotaxis response regulator CheB
MSVRPAFREWRPYAIAVDASMGGITALPCLLRALPGDLNATLFVVQHTTPDRRSRLSRILDAAGSLRCDEAVDGMPFDVAHVYLAPPDYHLQLETEVLRLSRTDRVCHVRPSVDVLFRSVAQTFGSRCIGVVLTGHLHDGSDGLRAIEVAGGITIVQDPHEAHAPGMPQNAMDAVRVNYCLPLVEIGPMLVRLTRMASRGCSDSPGHA